MLALFLLAGCCAVAWVAPARGLPLKRYTIIGQSSPNETITYEGSFEPVPGQHDIITALAQEFGNGNLSDLIDWLGGDSELADIASAGTEYELANDDSVFRISVFDESPTKVG